MGKPFKVGDHVTWNSEAGHVSGRIIKVHSKDVDYKGHTHHASEDELQYEIKSDKTDHIAMHKGSALKSSGRNESLIVSESERRSEAPVLANRRFLQATADCTARGQRLAHLPRGKTE